MNVRFTLPYIVVGLLSGAAWWLISSDSPQLSLGGLKQSVRTAIPGSDEAIVHGVVMSYNAGVTLAAPSVVSVYASFAPDQSDSSTPVIQSVRTSQGSGVIVEADGLIVTNRHIVDNADTINVALSDGRLHPATMIGSDSETDIAVLRIPGENLPALSLELARPLAVGDVVLAIGNPFGVGQTVTQGIVSATRRRIAGTSPWQSFVQIDAAINPGNSGGALINPAGELVGVNTAVFRGPNDTGPTPLAINRPDTIAQGIGFAIPATLVAKVVPDIVRFGRVARGWIGIDAADLPMFPDLARRLGTASGAAITNLVPMGPAERDGLSIGDVVTAIDGVEILNANALMLAIAAGRPQEVTRLDVIRDGNQIHLDVTLSESPRVEGRAGSRE